MEGIMTRGGLDCKIMQPADELLARPCSPKMSYKRRFLPQEQLTGNGWVRA
jgi:hypothetical protein